jgi:hypothetical protein
MSGKILKQCLIFGGEIKSPDSHQIEEQLDEFDEKRDFMQSEANQRPSAYVQVFESKSAHLFGEGIYTKYGLSTAMVQTVLECESDLLSVEEVDILERFSKLCCKISFLS